MILPTLATASALGLCGGLAAWQLHRRHLDRWLLPYLTTTGRRRSVRDGEDVHLILCIADHYEPKADGASTEQGRERVGRWVREYPRQLGSFRDSDGRPPRHSFFFPIEEYEPDYLDALAELCAAGFGEVEVHLHHDRDTTDRLRETLLGFKETLAARHHLLSRRRLTGELVYGFIHGNWTLNNGRPDGCWCGVKGELRVLRETGCYADFTFPSAPDVTQPGRINSLYWADANDPRPDAHVRGPDVGAERVGAEPLLMVQGPLLFDWRRRKWGVVPKIENGCLQPTQPPELERLALWLRARVQVSNRPDWFFVKLHAHGAPEDQADMLLGEPTVRFHDSLARKAEADPHFRYHYVTAREMVNLIRAAEDGWQGSVAEARDYELVSNLAASPDGPQEEALGRAAQRDV